LHQFLAGAGRAYTTLDPPGSRRITMDGQVFDPEDASKRLYALHFCRRCGQEFHPVKHFADAGLEYFIARDIDDTPPADDAVKEEDGPRETYGFLMPEPVDEFAFQGRDEDYPDAWQEITRKDYGEDDRFLPVLFCSPTMELGVDISALSTVYLRNMPPTPANYAQRSGRAGRSGQAALVLSYCSAQSPHDQYFFRDQSAMVHGVVRPPAIDLSNQDLVQSHLASFCDPKSRRKRQRRSFMRKVIHSHGCARRPCGRSRAIDTTIFGMACRSHSADWHGVRSA
jgi:hypothetical protein